MPGTVTMKQRGTCSKAMARAREERVLGAFLSQVRVSPGKKVRLSMDLQALGSKANLAMKLRTKLLGEEGEDVKNHEQFSSEREQKCEPSSVRLAAMVDEFLEDGSKDKRRGRSRSDDTSGEEECMSFFQDELAAILDRNVDNVSEKIVVSEVNIAVAAVNVGGGALRLQVFRHLRRAGFDTGLCKSKWDQVGGVPGGDYEYIDVVFEESSGRRERIIIDVDFKAQFEVARPTDRYNTLVQALPSVFVGRADQIQKIVNVMSEAVKLSLKKRGMPLPPWRTKEYMRAKWLASYKRNRMGEKSVDDSEISDGLNASAASLHKVTEPQKPENNPVLKESRTINRFVPGQGAGMILNSFDNNDWHLPSLKAKKSDGPRHAGLASLFRKPVAGLQEEMAKGPGVCA